MFFPVERRAKLHTLVEDMHVCDSSSMLLTVRTLLISWMGVALLPMGSFLGNPLDLPL